MRSMSLAIAKSNATYLSAPSRLGPHQRARSDERQLDPVVAVGAVLLVVPADLDLERVRPLGKMRDLLGLLGRVFPESIGDP